MAELSDYFKLPDGEKNEKLENMFVHNNGADYNPEKEYNSVEIFDSQWIDSSFIAPLSSLDPDHKRVALTQTAFFKFKSCRLGGNLACNMPAGINHLADPLADGGFRIVGLRSKKGMADAMSYGPLLQNTGLGRWYSENIDDHTQTVTIQFGVPKFNSLLSFLGSSTSFLDSYIANKGEIPSTYIIAKDVSDVVRCIAMPMTSLIVWALKMGISALLSNKPYSYYYLDPMMESYWATVNDISNYFAAKLGIMKPMIGSGSLEAQSEAAKGVTTGRAYKLDKEVKDMMIAMYGSTSGVFSDEFDFIDVYDIVSRRQYIFNQVRRKVHSDILGGEDGKEITEAPTGDKLGSATLTGDEEKDRQAVYDYVKSMFGALNEIGDSILDTGTAKLEGLGVESPAESLTKFGEYKQKALDDAKKEKEVSKAAKKDAEDSVKAIQALKGPFVCGDINGGADLLPSGSGNVTNVNTSSGPKEFGKSVWDSYGTYEESSWSRFVKGFDASSRGATSAAVFAVNPTGSTSDSISNSTSSIGTGDTIKGLTKAAHNAKFSIGGGNTGVDSIDWIKDKLIQVGAGMLESFSFGLSNLVNGILNGGYVDVPDKWEDSSFNGNSISYTMDLISPYGNEFSRFQNLFVPLAMILAGVLPRGIGKAAYTSPFICRAYSKSAQHIELGIITDVTVSSGITNQAFVSGVKTNSLRVTFTIKDLSNIMAAKVNTTPYFGVYRAIIDEDTPLSRWINRLAGVDYEDLTYMMPKMNMSIEIFGRSLSNKFNAARLGHALGNATHDSTLIGWMFKNPSWTGALQRNM